MPNEEEKAEAALQEATEPSLLSGETKDEEEVVPATAMKARWNTVTVQVCESHT